VRLLWSLAAVAVLTAGCAQTVQETWAKPGVTRQDVSRDYRECEQQASFDWTHGQEQGAYGFSVRMDRRVLASCMRSRGYELVSERK
jgi:hypothetical protein